MVLLLVLLINALIVFHKVPHYSVYPNIYHFIFPGPNIFLNTLFPNVPHLCFSLTTKKAQSHILGL